MNKPFQIDENSKWQFSTQMLVAIVGGIMSLAGVYYTLKQDIEEAKQLPKPPVSEVEFKLKDELIREAILNTQKDVSDIKESVKKLEERVYDQK
jgi:Tfp pilus assembly protein PilO